MVGWAQGVRQLLCPPATAVSPVSVPRSGPPSPASPPQPPPQVRAPTHSLLLRAADPTQSCAQALASRGGLGQDQRDRGHLPDLNRAQDLTGSETARQPREASGGGGPLCSVGELHVLWPQGRHQPGTPGNRTGQVGPLQVWMCRCASVRNGPLPKAVGPRLGRMPRGPPARPRQLAPGTLCCKPGPRAPLWGELWLLSFGPSFPSPPGLLGLPGRNSGSANRALCRLPGLPGLDTEQWQGL